MEVYDNLNLKDIEGEVWKQFYESKLKVFLISNCGRVKSVAKSNGIERIRKQKFSNKNRPYINLTKNRVEHVSRLVAKAFIANPNNLPVVAHNDNNPNNNTVENLRWDTQKGNMRQAFAEGRMIGIDMAPQPTIILTRNAELVGQFDSLTDARLFVNSTDISIDTAKYVKGFVLMKRDYYNDLTYDELLYICENVNSLGIIKDKAVC